MDKTYGTLRKKNMMNQVQKIEEKHEKKSKTGTKENENGAEKKRIKIGKDVWRQKKIFVSPSHVNDMKIRVIEN